MFPNQRGSRDSHKPPGAEIRVENGPLHKHFYPHTLWFTAGSSKMQLGSLGAPRDVTGLIIIYKRS